MAANINPIYARAADLQQAGVLIGPTNNTTNDGTGSAIYSIYQADATEGSFVQKVIIKPIGTGTTAANVVRIYYHNQSTFVAGTTNGLSNTTLIAELTTTSWTYSATLAAPQYEIPINIPMPAGTRLLMSVGTSTAAGNGFNPTVIAGKY